MILNLNLRMRGCIEITHFDTARFIALIILF